MTKKIHIDKNLFIRKIKCVDEDAKRVLIGFTNNEVTFQAILLPDRDLGVEYYVKYNKDYYGGIRWNTEKSRRNFVWYKNLLFECNVNSKHNWTIYDLKNKCIVCLMRGDYLYKDYNQYEHIKNTINKEIDKVQLDTLKGDFNKVTKTAAEVIEKYIKKFNSLYLQISNQDLLRKELIDNLVENYIYIEDDKVVVDWMWIDEDIETWFKNFIFAEKYKDKIKDVVTEEFVYKKIPDLKNLDGDIVESIYQEAIKLQNDEYIYYSVDNILLKIQESIDAIEYQKQEELKEIKNQELMKKKELEFNVLYDKLVNNFELEYYYTPFYEIVEKGKRINIDEIKWNKFTNYKVEDNYLTAQELLEYELIYKNLKPRYDHYVLGKRKTKRLIIENLRKHIQYFEKIVAKLYKFEIIKDIGNIVEINSYLNFDKFRESVDF